jgi:hypothetical protein
MNENEFSELIKIRNIFKRLSQLSWASHEFEMRYPMGSPENEKQLLALYKQTIPDAVSVLKDLEEQK